MKIRRGQRPRSCRQKQKTPKVVPTVCSFCEESINRFEDYIRDGNSAMHARCARRVQIALEEVGCE